MTLKELKSIVNKLDRDIEENAEVILVSYGEDNLVRLPITSAKINKQQPEEGDGFLFCIRVKEDLTKPQNSAPLQK